MSSKVSVIIPTYNRGYIIRKSVESVLNQTYRDYELIIVDDGSTDDTESVIRGYDDARIRYCRLDVNGGVCAARNYGISIADGGYIAFQDSDDMWYPDKLERQMALIENDEGAGFVYCKLKYRLGENAEVILPDERVPYDRKSGDIYRQVLWDNLIPCPCLVARKVCFDEIGGFDGGFAALEDYDLAIRLAKNYRAAFVDDVLMEAHVSQGGVSDNTANYLASECMLLGKHKKDFLDTNTFNHRVERILDNAEQAGVKDAVVAMLERVLGA